MTEQDILFTKWQRMEKLVGRLGKNYTNADCKHCSFRDKVRFSTQNKECTRIV